MNNRTFYPRNDLPRCDVCDATMIEMQTLLPELRVRVLIEYVVRFACGASWNATHKKCFRATSDSIPDGSYTPWSGGSPTTFLEVKPCPNAARFLRQLRNDVLRDKGITPE